MIYTFKVQSDCYNRNKSKTYLFNFVQTKWEEESATLQRFFKTLTTRGHWKTCNASCGWERCRHMYQDHCLRYRNASAVYLNLDCLTTGFLWIQIFIRSRNIWWLFETSCMFSSQLLGVAYSKLRLFILQWKFVTDTNVTYTDMS